MPWLCLGLAGDGEVRLCLAWALGLTERVDGISREVCGYRYDDRKFSSLQTLSVKLAVGVLECPLQSPGLGDQPWGPKLPSGAFDPGAGTCASFCHWLVCTAWTRAWAWGRAWLAGALL